MELKRFFLCLAAILFVCSSFSFAQTQWEIGSPNARNLIATWSSDTKTLTISGTGGMKNYSKITTPPWSSLPIQTVVVKEGVSSLGNYTFSGCKTLTSISLPTSLTRMGDEALSMCEKLSSLTLPANLKAIGNYAFAECIGLTSVTVLNPVPAKINESVFVDISPTCKFYTTTDAYRTANGWANFEFGLLVTFDALGGTPTPEQQKLPVGENIKEPSVVPNRPGFTFQGWFNRGSKFTFNYPVSTTNSLTLTAQWKVITFTVTYVVNTDEGEKRLASTYSKAPNDVYYTVETATFPLEVPVRGGYSFGGWYTNEDLSGTPITTVPKGSTGNKTFYAKWEPVKYNSTYNLGGGKGVAANSTYSLSDSPIALPAPTKNGYTFEGWYETGDFSTLKVANIPSASSGNKNFHAKWSLDTYTITYNLNGGTTSSAITGTYNVTSTAITLPTPIKTGYIFGGWYASANFSGAKVSNIPTGSTGHKTFYAKWALNTYIINYKSDGGTIFESSSYTVTSPTVILPIPTKNGHIFEGWYETANFSTLKVTEIPSGNTGNKVFYAKWSLNPYTITYHQDGGTGTSTTTYTISNSPIPLPTPVKAGYTFRAWYENASFSGSPVYVIPGGSTGDKTFYANWTLNVYTITYELNGATSLSDSVPVTTYTVASPAIALPTPIRDGYTFDGWYEKAYSSTLQATVIPTGSTGHKTFYAKWTPIQHSIAFEQNGGSGAGNRTYNIETETFMLPTDTEMKKNAYTFGGWYDNSGLTGTVFTSIPIGSTSDKTFYAKWTPTIFFISYNQNNGSGADHAPATYTVESPTITLPTATEMTKNGYTFEGWYENEHFLGTRVLDIPIGSFGDKTLHAKWQTIFYHIVYEKDGGSGDGKDNYTVETATFDLPTAAGMTKKAYTFAGWYDNGGLTGITYTTIPVGSTGDKTLYAKWILTNYTITYITNGGKPIENTTYTFESPTSTLPTEMNKPGYNFVAWYDNADFSGAKVTNIPTGSTGNKTFYAQWVPTTYTITYEQNNGGGAGNTTYTVESSTINLPSASVMNKDGYTFGGWYDNSGLTGTLFTALLSGSTGNKTFYADWIPVTYNITYEKNGGTGATNSTYNIESPALSLPTTMSKTGYTFEGWYETADFSGAKVTVIPAGSTDNKTFYAKWAPITYNLTYEQNNGQGGLSPTYTIESPAITLLFASEMTKESYTFAGWYDNSGLLGTVFTILPKGSFGHKTFYAKWIPISYKIDFEQNGGSGAGNTTYTVESDAITLPTAANMNKIGYTFDGWYEKSDFTEPKIYAIPAGTSGDKTFYAKWTLITYKINYEQNSGTGANNAVYTIETPTFTLPAAPGMTRNGYTFAGWYDNSDLMGTAFTSIAQGSVGDKTFCAKWTSLSYNITYEQNGGTGAENATYTIESGLLSLPTAATMKRENYDFAGWFENAELTGTPITAIQGGNIGDKVLYAKWVPVSFPIVYVQNGGTGARNIAYTIETPTFNLPKASEVTKNGYALAGWYDNKELTGTAFSTISGGSTGEKTFYAKWTPVAYTITYEQNGGSGAGIATYTIESTLASLPAETEMTKKGFTFAGWYDNSNLTGSALTSVPTGSTGNKTYYAKWDSNSATVTFIAEKGSKTPAQVVEKGSMIKRPNDPTRKKHSFVAWLDSKGAAFDFNTPLTEDITLTAQWEKNKK
ncbi:hypothetical protein FACS1894199_05900 [Bacteroidia bacterium]|nr:hypothetical protein FACS1894199_05900 [Bacteroidia bacterium]